MIYFQNGESTEVEDEDIDPERLDANKDSHFTPIDTAKGFNSRLLVLSNTPPSRHQQFVDYLFTGFC